MTLHGFRDKPIAEKLVQIARGEVSARRQIPRFPGGIIVTTPAEGIPKREGSDVGYALCTIKTVKGTPLGDPSTGEPSLDEWVFNQYPWLSGASQIYVGNLSTSTDIAGSKDIMAMWVPHAWIAVWEDCG